MGKPTVPLTCRLPAEVEAAVREEAVRAGLSLNGAIVEAVREWVSRRRGGVAGMLKPGASGGVTRAEFEALRAELVSLRASVPPPSGLSVMPSEPAVEGLTVAPVAVSERVATGERVEVKVEGATAPESVPEPLPAPPHVPWGMTPLPPREVEVDPTVPPQPLPSDVEDLMNLLP
jgi:hypothetical protein